MGCAGDASNPGAECSNNEPGLMLRSDDVDSGRENGNGADVLRGTVLSAEDTSPGIGGTTGVWKC